jgi:tetratricopeptide (TPR) repeat protein
VDAVLLWTVVGSVAGAAGVVVAVTVPVIQARSELRRRALTAPNVVPVSVEPLGVPRDKGAVAGTVLRAPTGRLPDRMRGRDDLLARLGSLVSMPDGRTHLLAGLGGTGKSTVALQVAEQAGRSGRRVWWVTASDAGTVTAALMGLAENLGAPRDEVADALAGRRSPADLLWRFLEIDPGWLLVFDDLDDPGILAVGRAGVDGGAGWIRPTVSGLIVVTSRVNDPHMWGRHVEIHMVSWLEAAIGAQVLDDLAPDAGPPRDAEELSARLGGLPLALHHVGLHLASDFAAERTFGQYKQALEQRFRQLMGHGRGDDRAIVTSTWELSLDALATGGRAQARPLLRVLSCLAPAAVIPSVLLDLEVLGQMCDDGEDDAVDGLTALSSVGLITAVPSGSEARPGVTIHPLVAEASRFHLDSEDPARAGKFAIALLTAAAARLSHEQPEDWPVWVQLAPHVNAVYGYLASRLAATDLAALVRVSSTAAAAFAWAGAYPDSEELARFALEHAASRLSADHEAVLSLRLRLATARMLRGRYIEAEQEYRDILTTQQRLLGPRHLETLATRYEIARALAAQGQHEQAEQEYRDVLAARLPVLGPDHPHTLGTRHEIARMLAAQDRYEQAEQEYQQVLAAQSRVLGPGHSYTLATRYEMARTLAAQGQHEQAEQQYRNLLAMERRIFGPDHPETLATRYEIARMLAVRGQQELAEQAYRDVLSAQQRVLGPDHPATVSTRNAIDAMHPQGQAQPDEPPSTSGKLSPQERPQKE